jgi:hypothetical protein
MYSVCVSDAGRLEKTPTIVVTKFDPKMLVFVSTFYQNFPIKWLF